MNDNQYNAAKFMSRFLTVGTVQGLAAKNEDKAGDDDGHPLMPDDKNARHKIHRALHAVHHAVFGNSDNDTVEKARKAHGLLVDAAKPHDDGTDNKAKKGAK